MSERSRPAPPLLATRARRAFAILGLLTSVLAGQAVTLDLAHQPGWITQTFIADTPPTPSSHASTIVETQEGLLAAWFGGPYERHPEVTIWTSRYDGKRWSSPQQVADGIQPDSSKRYPCWNPVLFQPSSGPLLLFYKVGPSPDRWWGMQVTSTNNGHTWSPPTRLPEGLVGPVRNKPVELADGSLLCGASTEDRGWQVHMERTPDGGRTWEKTAALNRTNEFGAIQPTLLVWPGPRIQILNRTRQGRITENWMRSSWRDWTSMRALSLPNPNSGIDAVMLRDGRALLVYNHTAKGRSVLNVALSPDGARWEAALILENEPGEYSYPAVIQSRDGLVHITYTWRRERVRHVTLDPNLLRTRPIASNAWPD